MTLSISANDDNRSRLVKAAAAAFGQHGFHGTTTRDIAAAAGMSPAALYFHHRSKEDLLFLISHEGHVASLNTMREARKSSTSPTEQLRLVMSAFTAWHARAHAHARVVNYELGALTGEHLVQIQDLRRAMDAEMRGIVEAGVACSEFRVPDVRMAANALLSLGVDVARWYHEGGRWSPEELGEAYAELALRIVGAG